MTCLASKYSDLVTECHDVDLYWRPEENPPEQVPGNRL